MFLSGIRVLEVASVITGPMAGQMLADLGADVVKVESPPDGDAFRKWEGRGAGVRPPFAAFNRGKRSLALDLRAEEDRALYRRLLEGADVVIENFRHGAMDRLGFSWDKVRALNPRLIYCYVSGFGTVGPDRERPAYDAVAQAASGLWSQFVDLGAPEPVGPPLADQLTAMNATIAVLAGLQRRAATGSGIRVEVDMLSSCLALQSLSIASYSREGKVPHKKTRAYDSQAYAFVAADGKPFCIHLSSVPKFWLGLCRAVERPQLAEDERFAAKRARVENYEALHAELAGVFAARPREEWLRRLQEQDVPCAPILDLAEALATPQAVASAIVTAGDDEGLDGLARLPIRADGALVAADRRPPLVDEHRHELVGELEATVGGAVDA
jgi:crotonobetainyl-CoA:carnitine CoA-transferase CaiB-like acyl-CoA transferase